MDPVVRYCTSADGTRIGYTTYGRLHGVPVVLGSGWVYTQEVSWAIPQTRQFYESFASAGGLIAWDRRGTGRSGPELRSLSLDVEVADLEAVVDDVGAETFDIFAYDANPAIAYAARHPDRVRRLVLYDPLLAPRPYGKMVDMITEDWAIARRALAAILFPDGPVGLQKTWSNAMRDGTSAENAATYMRYESRLDLRGFPELVRVPTLVIRPGGSKFVRSDSEDAAARIADARMVRLEHDHPWYTDPDALIAPVCEFLGRAPAAADSAEPPTNRTGPEAGTAVILFADIADSTALTERLGDTAFRDAARALDGRLRAAVREAGGTPVEGRLLGDGLMATFPSGKEAIEGALRCRDLSAESELRLRIGLHAGDVIREGDNVFGGAVNIAARVQDVAAPGEVLVSATVRDLARTSAGVSFEDRGERELKGLSEPVRVFAVRRRGRVADRASAP
jgi:class 3 adenylate cyclase/pimeloyl-ACP methyl ester carboxylesterase